MKLIALTAVALLTATVANASAIDELSECSENAVYISHDINKAALLIVDSELVSQISKQAEKTALLLVEHEKLFGIAATSERIKENLGETDMLNITMQNCFMSYIVAKQAN